MNQINRVGNILPTRTRENPNQGRVYDVTGIAPAICCGGGTPLIIERSDNEDTKESGSGGVYSEASRDFQRGMLPGISRTIKAEKHDACVVEMVVYEDEAISDSSHAWQKSNEPKQQDCRHTDRAEA